MWFDLNRVMGVVLNKSMHMNLIYGAIAVMMMMMINDEYSYGFRFVIAN